MDLNEYHRAWMNGCSESESLCREEEKWSEDQHQQYFQELEKQIEKYIFDNTDIKCNWCGNIVKAKETTEINAVYWGITDEKERVEKERVCKKCLDNEA